MRAVSSSSCSSCVEDAGLSDTGDDWVILKLRGFAAARGGVSCGGGVRAARPRRRESTVALPQMCLQPGPDDSHGSLAAARCRADAHLGRRRASRGRGRHHPGERGGRAARLLRRARRRRLGRQRRLDQRARPVRRQQRAVARDHLLGCVVVQCNARRRHRARIEPARRHAAGVARGSAAPARARPRVEPGRGHDPRGDLRAARARDVGSAVQQHERHDSVVLGELHRAVCDRLHPELGSRAERDRSSLALRAAGCSRR